MDQVTVEKQPLPEIVPEGQQKSTITSVAAPELPKPVVLEELPANVPESASNPVLTPESVIIPTIREHVSSVVSPVDTQSAQQSEQPVQTVVSEQVQTVEPVANTQAQPVTAPIQEPIASVETVQNTIKNDSVVESQPLSTNEVLTEMPENPEKMKLQREYAFVVISSILSEEKRGPSPDGTLRKLSIALKNEEPLAPDHVADLEPLESLKQRLQIDLHTFRQSASEQVKIDARESIRSSLRELSWRNGFDEILPMLSGDELDGALHFTRHDVSKVFGTLFDPNINIGVALANAKESWNVHKHLVSAKKDLELSEKYQWMKEPLKSFIVGNEKASAINWELSSVTMKSIGDYLTAHPNESDEGMELFMKYIMPYMR